MFTVKKCKPMEGQKKRKYSHYPRQLKIKVAEEIITGKKGTSEAARDYDIARGVAMRWAKRFRFEILEGKSVEVVSSLSMRLSKSTQQKPDLLKQVQTLEEENSKLRQKLLESNLKTEALSTLIDLAEENYGISLRKNSGAKQSRD
jgi:transposase